MIATLAVVAAVWMILSALALPGFSFAASRWKRRTATWTDWTLWQPEVPEPKLRTVEADDYLNDLPVDCLSDDEIRRRCERMEQYL